MRRMKVGKQAELVERQLLFIEQTREHQKETEAKLDRIIQLMELRGSRD